MSKIRDAYSGELLEADYTGDEAIPISSNSRQSRFIKTSTIGAATPKPWSKITDTPTTLSGYGITDAAGLVHGHVWSDLTSGFPTTLSGYGITDLLAESTSVLKGAYYASNDTSIIDHGNASTVGSIAWCASQIGSSVRAIVLPHGTYNIDQALTIASNITLITMPGAIMTRTGGTHLTINGALECGNWQCFVDNTSGNNWVVFNKKQTVSPDMWGAIGDGIVSDVIPFSCAANSICLVGGSIELPSGKIYNGNSTEVVIDGSDIEIYGGGKLYNLRTIFSSDYSDTGINLHDFTYLSNQSDWYHLDLRASNSRVERVTFDHETDGGTYQAYIRKCSNVHFVNNKTFRGDGLYVEGSDIVISGNQMSGVEFQGDDAIAIKSITVPSERITITGNTFYSLGGVAIGSEVGQLTTTGDYTDRVVGVTISNNTFNSCNKIAYIKPGGGIVNYNKGLVDGVSIVGNVLNDPDGNYYENAINFRPGRDAVVRNVDISSNVVSARSFRDAGQSFHVWFEPYEGGTPASSFIDNVTISGNKFFDKFDGAANAVDKPGYPVKAGIQVESVSSAIIKNIYIKNNTINGSSSSGISIGSGITGDIHIHSNSIRNAVASSSITSYGIQWASAVSIVGNEVDVLNYSPVSPIYGYGDTDLYSESFSIQLGSVAASDNAVWTAFVAPGDCFVYRAYVTNAATVAHDVANYNLLFIQNGATSENLAILSQATTDLTAFTPALIDPNGSQVLNIPLLYGSNACGKLSKGQVLKFFKNHYGSGLGLTNAMLTLYYVRY